MIENMPRSDPKRSRCNSKQKYNDKKYAGNVTFMDNVLNRFATTQRMLRYLIIFAFFLGVLCIIISVSYTLTLNHTSIIRPRLIDLHKFTWSKYSTESGKGVHGYNTLIDRRDSNYSSPKQSLNYRVTTIIGVNNLRSRSTKTQYPLTLEAPYFLSDPNLCKSVTNLSALVIVHTAPNHFERRDIMRKTWTNNSYFHHLGYIRILFLLGTVLDNETQRKIEDEFKKHGDILQGDFIDAYINLTHKGVMGYKWISENCMNARIIVKVDDDVLVDTYKLLTEYLPKLSGRRRYILCNYIYDRTMPIIREKNNKWYVASDFFSGHRFYPQYCSGFGVIISTDIIPFLYRAAYLTPFFWVDDVYLYGLLPSKVKDISYISLAHRFSLQFEAGLECFKNNSKLCPFLISSGRTPEEVAQVWDAMGKAYERVSIINLKTYNISPENDDKMIDNGQIRKDSDKTRMPQQVNVQTKQKDANTVIKTMQYVSKTLQKIPQTRCQNCPSRVLPYVPEVIILMFFLMCQRCYYILHTVYNTEIFFSDQDPMQVPESSISNDIVT
ncbi:hypothetical protein CHS0354_031614 [Potamilus streckersoni]|uniref:Hexosyltransferase n=1 Tax=Potamilus streckersoni TaxID=2493646 RepID=A0AAE0VUU5_9BIVA|nr:hypothetical protein CHS0354_031614 [Potamilus streckersoni]